LISVAEIVEHNAELDMIVIRSRGKVHLMDLVEAREVVSLMMRTTGTKRILVDVREQNTLVKRIKAWEFGASILDRLPRTLRMAIVYCDAISENVTFFIGAAQGQGYNIEKFDDYDEALAWLKKEND